MALFNWDTKYSVGISSIDVQHQKLIALINKLHEAMAQGKSKEVLGGVLKELIDYTVLHFNFEEGLLKKAGYSALPSHKIQHTGFISKINDFNSKFDEGKTSISIDILSFLKQWLIEHIMVTDRAYSSDLISKNIK